jgi:beta-mannosidase
VPVAPGQPARCAGTLYRQLGDCWPGPSWSSVDFEGRWKKAHYVVRALYAPTTLLLAEEKATEANAHPLTIWTTSGTDPFRGRVELAVLAFDGDTVKTLPPHAIDLAPHAVTPVATLDLTVDAFGPSTPPERHLLLVRLLDENGTEIATRVHHALPEKDLDLAEPRIRATFTQAPGAIDITLTAESYAADVHLESTAPPPNDPTHRRSPSDDFFPLLPGRPKTVRYPTDLSPDAFARTLTIRHL